MRVMMSMLGASCVSVLLSVAAFTGEAPKKSCCEGKQVCASKTAKAGKLRCSLTGTVVESCCCAQREGKLYCTLAKKEVDSCCCRPAGKACGVSGEPSKGETSGGSLRY